MATQAKITLTCQNGNVTPAERTLILESGSPIAPIGRASKSISKGLFSSYDNAWFDSPVMSRDHAQLTMNSEDKTINIRDIGSMHGTYVNGVELARHVPLTLNNGDIVVFGAEVRRGPETFPACSFRIAIEFSDRMTTNTFSVPESSDIEDADDDAEDDEVSEDDHARRQQQSSSDGCSIEPASPQAQKINNAIDLTRDSPEPTSNRIDLTGETPSEKNTVAQSAARATDTNGRVNLVGIGMYTGFAPILVESEDEQFETGFTESAEHSEDGSSDSDGSEDSNICIDEEVYNSSGDSEAESEDIVMDGQNDMESVHGFSDMDEDEDISIGNFARRHTRPAHDNPTILLSDIRTRTQFPESVADDEDEDNESEFGLSEAGEAGLRALIDGGLLNAPTNAVSEHDHESESEKESENESEDEEEPAPQPEPETRAEVVVIPSVKESVRVHAPISTPESLPPLQFAREHRYRTLQNFTGDKLGISYPSIRQPSPSDAAMVKSAAPPQQSKPLSGVCEIGTFAQMLGDKTGKVAFFEAREINKAKFNDETKPVRSGFASFKISRNSGFGQSSSLAPSLPSETPSIRHTGFKCGTNLSRTFEVGPNAEPAFPIREPCSFLDEPDKFAIPARTPSPQLDMTSAYNFHLSKAATTTPSPLNTNPRGIKINDIIDTSATPQRSYRLKRKADDISDVTDEEIRIWARASSGSSVTKIKLDSIVKETPLIDEAANGVPPLAPIATHVVSEPRPAKRMKKFLENVGYAALGGVAVGAGLFTVLVATAPDFL
ncbi:uncharacterized protein LY89DRAFT_688532 [Mollisia scopiformis]|uniref:FHA domain-containing protein n=1 Tax=Mollisia scopiformis TaxID=149040 RepID=A0A194WWK0_MOLSC|nr:uncharacterized protein LY89DRAFT_688532 [Mollisia scopiformis]KUJ12059.1 hypothetical protein LY89DRAFT_688532 [Mollisia scopiformis]